MTATAKVAFSATNLRLRCAAVGSLTTPFGKADGDREPLVR